MPSKTHAVESIPSLSAAQNKARALLVGRCKPHLVQDVYLQNQGVRATTLYALMRMGLVGVDRLKGGTLVYRLMEDGASRPSPPHDSGWYLGRFLNKTESLARHWFETEVGERWVSAYECNAAGVAPQVLRRLMAAGQIDSKVEPLPGAGFAVSYRFANPKKP